MSCLVFVYFRADLQADAFASYNQIHEDGRIVEASFWSMHAERCGRVFKSHWTASMRFAGDGRIEAPNNASVREARLHTARPSNEGRRELLTARPLATAPDTA